MDACQGLRTATEQFSFLIFYFLLQFNSVMGACHRLFTAPEQFVVAVFVFVFLLFLFVLCVRACVRA